MLDRILGGKFLKSLTLFSFNFIVEKMYFLNDWKGIDGTFNFLFVFFVWFGVPTCCHSDYFVYKESFFWQRPKHFLDVDTTGIITSPEKKYIY